MRKKSEGVLFHRDHRMQQPQSARTPIRTLPIFTGVLIRVPYLECFHPVIDRCFLVEGASSKWNALKYDTQCGERNTWSVYGF